MTEEMMVYVTEEIMNIKKLNDDMRTKSVQLGADLESGIIGVNEYEQRTRELMNVGRKIEVRLNVLIDNLERVCDVSTESINQMRDILNETDEMMN